MDRAETTTVRPNRRKLADLEFGSCADRPPLDGLASTQGISGHVIGSQRRWWMSPWSCLLIICSSKHGIPCKFLAARPVAARDAAGTWTCSIAQTVLVRGLLPPTGHHNVFNGDRNVLPIEGWGGTGRVARAAAVGGGFLRGAAF